VRIPYGQPEREVELKSASSLGYTDEDLFIVDPRDPRRQVPMRDRHLDAQRAVEELRALADLAEGEPALGAVDHIQPSAADHAESEPGHGGDNRAEGEAGRVTGVDRLDAERRDPPPAADRVEAGPRRETPAADRVVEGERRRAAPGADIVESERGRATSGADRLEAERRRETPAAERMEGERWRAAPAVALVDGTLLFSVLEERPRDFLRSRFYSDFVRQLERLRRARVPVAAYASRTRGIDLVHLFRAMCGSTPLLCQVCTGAHACAMRGLTDADLLGRGLDRWDRSGLFRVRSNVHDPYYGIHRVYFFLFNTGDEIARIELPEWVARDRALLTAVHGMLVDQCLKGFGYPAVLARADDRAVISLGDRGVLDTLVQQELARRGVLARPSAKLSRKQVRTV
jgi:hypothetical protein